MVCSGLVGSGRVWYLRLVYTKRLGRREGMIVVMVRGCCSFAFGDAVLDFVMAAAPPRPSRPTFHPGPSANLSPPPSHSFPSCPTPANFDRIKLCLLMYDCIQYLYFMPDGTNCTRVSAVSLRTCTIRITLHYFVASACVFTYNCTYECGCSAFVQPCAFLAPSASSPRPCSGRVHLNAAACSCRDV